MTLPARRRRVLGAIASHPGPGAPTYREIGIIAGLSSVSSVRHQLLMCKRGGWVVWDPEIPGSLRLADGVVVWSPAAVSRCRVCGVSLPDGHTHIVALQVALDAAVARIEAAHDMDAIRARLNSAAVEAADTPREDTP